MNNNTIYKMEDQFFIDAIKKIKVSEVTKKNYFYTMQFMQTIILNTKFVEILKNPDEFALKLKEYIFKHPNDMGVFCLDTLNTELRFYQFVMILCKHIDELKNVIPVDKWKKMFDKYFAMKTEQYSNNEPTVKQKLSYIPYEELVKKAKELKEGDIKRLLIMMYTEIPPVRADYWKCFIIREENEVNDSANFVDLIKNIVVIREHKTSKKNGPITTVLPDILKREIEISLSKWPRKYLFESTGTYEPYKNRHSFIRWANSTLKKVFANKFICLTTLRHIYLSRKDVRSRSVPERLDIAGQMGHSFKTQKIYSWHKWIEDNGMELKDVQKKLLKESLEKKKKIVEEGRNAMKKDFER